MQEKARIALEQLLPFFAVRPVVVIHRTSREMSVLVGNSMFPNDEAGKSIQLPISAPKM